MSGRHSAQSLLEAALQGANDARVKAGYQPPVLLNPIAIGFIFGLVEGAFQEGGWSALEAALEKVPEFANPMGSLGPLWCAIQMERGKEVRAGIEWIEVAHDIREGLNRHGRMRFDPEPKGAGQ